MTLTETLLDYNTKGRARIPAQTLEVMDAATQDLINKNLSKKSIKKGDTLTTAELINTKNEKINIDEMLKKGPLVISFYRGGWCPYCNFELRALQGALPQIKESGANLIAITPETPDNSLTTSEKNEIAFNVLTDTNNNYARELGLVFKMPKALQEVYKSFGIDLEAHNGNADFELPMPATLVVNSNKEVSYSFVSEDYTKRADIPAILDALN